MGKERRKVWTEKLKKIEKEKDKNREKEKKRKREW